MKRKYMAKVIGIDLGTTNSCVAVMEGGKPKVIENAEGARTTPSIVAFTKDGERLIGQPAKRQAVTNGDNTIFAVKRLIGRRFDDPVTKKDTELVPYPIVKGKNGDAWVKAGGEEYSPSQISAFILQKMKETAEAYLGETVTQAVITVPAYFNDAQRQATKDAGQIAGLEVLRLLAEPTAAALAYGLDQGAKGRYAVYDLGGGTFDVSILELHQGVFKVVATGGDTALGGDDIDRALAGRLLTAGADAGQVTRALEEARAAKHRLTDADATEMRLGDTRVPLTRGDLAEVMRPWLDKTGRAVKRALKDAELDADELDGVILVGGSTKSPVVRAYVRELFGREPLCQLDPEEVVALGAATQAHLLSGGAGDVLLLDVIPLSLGLETMGGVVEKLIPRNSTIPARALQTFTTYADNQTGFDLHVVQGERETAAGNRSLARFQLRGLPPMPAGMARMEIRFEVDADGLLTVSARELTTGTQTAVEVKPSYGLSPDEVERMLLESYEHAEADLRERQLLTERVEAEQVVAMTRAAMERDPELLPEGARGAIEAALEVVERAMGGEDHVAIRRAVEALDAASRPFAEARMNRAVRDAVRGKRVDEVAG
ncbi:MAG TPA: Fe-S protein assembly chaperone HscA [Kofleriaceae bacterium]|nr:Fe-S protein assembly chaperone HscA [Kofleriaceae bacterium]